MGLSLKEQNGMRWHEFELLAECPITHATFTRHGGYSQNELASLNFGSRVGDEADIVKKNINKAMSQLNVEHFACAKISHGIGVHAINAIETPFPISDALSTSIPDFGLLISHADCQAAIVYDPIHHAIANVHCGWRGNAQNIFQTVVSHMQQQYHSNPSDLLICISPSLGPEHSEFVNYRQEMPAELWEFQIRPNFFDLWAISEWQLRNAGILPHHIQIAKIDTWSNQEDYFSYRRSKICGRQATICALH